MELLSTTPHRLRPAHPVPLSPPPLFPPLFFPGRGAESNARPLRSARLRRFYCRGNGSISQGGPGDAVVMGSHSREEPVPLSSLLLQVLGIKKGRSTCSSTWLPYLRSRWHLQ